MRKKRLKWFRHIIRRPIEVTVRRIDCLNVARISRGRERPKKT